MCASSWRAWSWVIIGSTDPGCGLDGPDPEERIRDPGRGLHSTGVGLEILQNRHRITADAVHDDSEEVRRHGQGTDGRMSW